MPIPYYMIPSPTIFARQEDPLADPSPTASVFVSQVPVVVVDTTPLSPIAMIAIKLYAFGGLAFLFAVVLTGITYWIWVVVIKGEFADSPPELDIHPERMREREKARIARLKVKKEKREAERKRQKEEKWRVPPIQYDKKKHNNKTRSTTRTNDNTTPRPKPAIKNTRRRYPSTRTGSSSSSSSSSRRSTPPAKKKSVTWAASASTLDEDGTLRSKPVEDPENDRPAWPLQEVRHAHPRRRPSRSYSIDARSAQGPELIGRMNPEMVSRWARSPD